MSRPARPMGQHDTTELERLQRAERRAARIVAVTCAIVLAYVACNAPELARAVML